jgi:hypothetical protein
MKKEVYEKPRPKSLGKPKALSANQKKAAKAFANQKKAAKAFAKKSGTAYPSLLANMAGARAKK